MAAQKSRGLTIIPASSQHTTTIIFLHGLGQTADSWIPDLESLSQRLPFAKWVIPQARKQRVTMSGGEYRPSWFDIKRLPPFTHEFDESGVTESINLIEQLILGEMHTGIDPKRIILAGFSQGAALSLMVALTSLHDIGGVASFAGWIPHRIRDHIMQTEPSLPVFWGHGEADTDIPFQYAQNSMDFLKNRLCLPSHLLTIIKYRDLDHETSTEELRDFARWVRTVQNGSHH